MNYYYYSFIILIIVGIIVGLILFFISRNKIIKEMPKNYFSLQKEKIVSDIPLINQEKEIPKIIHRTHENNELINLFSDIETQIKKENPEYTIINYTSVDIEEFIKNNYSNRIYKAYKSINPKYGAARADFFRYLVVYLKGGIYLDIKSYPIKNLDNLLKKAKNRMIVSSDHSIFSFHWQVLFPYGEYSQWSIISPKGHPVMKEIINRVLGNIESGYLQKELYKGRIGTLCLTGPIMYTNIINNVKNTDSLYFSSKFYDNYLKKFNSDYYSDKKQKQINNLGSVRYSNLNENIVIEYRI